MATADAIQVNVVPNRTEVAQALGRFRASKPDAIVGCTQVAIRPLMEPVGGDAASDDRHAIE